MDFETLCIPTKIYICLAILKLLFIIVFLPSSITKIMVRILFIICFSGLAIFLCYKKFEAGVWLMVFLQLIGWVYLFNKMTNKKSK